MKYFYDTEFIDNGETIDLISIGIVSEDGEPYYAVSNEFDQHAVKASPWLLVNVWPHLPLTDEGWLDVRTHYVRNRSTIARGVLDFLTMGDRDNPELWAWYAAYDHVALAQLWGPMNQLPDGLPKYTHDLKQEYDRQGRTWKPPTDASEHDALADARWNLELAKLLGIVKA